MAERAVAVVTGAGKGIGQAIALRLANDGFAIIGSSRTEDDLARLTADVAALGSEARTIVADAQSREGAKAPVVLALEQYGRVEVLVNNIGGYVGIPLDPFDTTDDEFDGTVTYTLSSPWWTTTAALPAMRSRGYGRVINIGSGAAIHGAGTIGYAAAKHGIAGMTKTLAIAAAKYGITVNCVCPGYTNTPRLQESWKRRAKATGRTEEEARARAATENAQQRVLEPSEVANAVAFVASPGAHGITGQIISVDGGYHL